MIAGGMGLKLHIWYVRKFIYYFFFLHKVQDRVSGENDKVSSAVQAAVGELQKLLTSSGTEMLPTN